MRRKTFDMLLATGGLVVAVILAISGGLLLWAHSFVDTNVHNQLAQQQIEFPAKGDPGLKADPEITKYVTPYAGQQVLNGKQAEVFADHYIAVHLREIGAGQTYSQVSAKFLALSAKNPNAPQLAQLAQQRQTLFMGETLRGLLLNAYAFWKMGQIALIAGITAFITSAVMLLLSGLGFRHLRLVPADAEVLPRLGAHTPAPVER